MSLIDLAAPVWRVCGFCLIFVPFGHYDEPETLPYEIRLVCSIGADVKQHAKETIFGAILGTARKMELANEKRAEEIVEFIGLGDVKHELAVNLSHGHQRTLNVAMAVAAEPRLLMLDEPVAGMNPSETAAMTDIIRKLRKEWGITVILVEHDMRTVMNLCEHITVINFGKKLAEGSPDEIISNPEVIEAYLGSDDILGEDF